MHLVLSIVNMSKNNRKSSGDTKLKQKANFKNAARKVGEFKVKSLKLLRLKQNFEWWCLRILIKTSRFWKQRGRQKM